MDNTVYAFYTSGCVEKLRVVERRCRLAGRSFRLMTVRTLIGSKLAKRYVGPQWMFALHAVGGGFYHDFSSDCTERISKRRIERHFSKHATLYRRK